MNTLLFREDYQAALLRRNNNRLKVKMDELMVRVESLETKA